MSEGNVAERGDGVLEVSGRVTFETVPHCLTQAAPWFDQVRSDATVDLAKVTQVDTAGVALMLEWLAQAQAKRHNLKFVNFPEQVRHLIDVSGLNKAFGLS